MGVIKWKIKEGLFIKTWERLSSRNGQVSKYKSKSWPRSGGAVAGDESPEEDGSVCRSCNNNRTSCRVGPVGCFSVYVGPQKQRFVAKTDWLSHPLFKELLEEAESEYGFNSDGPIELPCEVDDFLKVLVEMGCDEVRPSCIFGRTYSSYYLLNPPKLL